VGYLKAIVMVFWLFAAGTALAHDCECDKKKALQKKELRYKLEMASANSKLLADIIVSTPHDALPDTRKNILKEYRYWADEVERLFEEAIDEAYEKMW